MSRFVSRCAFALTLLVGCTQGPEPDQTQPVSGGGDESCTSSSCGSGGGGSDSGGGSGEEAVCLDRQPTGDLTWSFDLPSFYYLSGGSVAVDKDGAVLHSHGGSTSFIGPRTTIKVSADGSEVYRFAFGGEVATDGLGNAYVAGPFGEPMDLGLGTLTPAGIGSVYLAKIDAAGNLVSVKDVKFPTDASQVEQGALGIAVTPDASLFAVSTELGTVVFDSLGREKFRTPYIGKVAFGPDGRLVVTAFLRDLSGDSVVVKFDEDGCVLWRQTFGNPGDFNEFTIATDLAIDANGDIVAIGEVGGQSYLFGEHFVPDEVTYGEYTVRHGAYVVKMSPDGNLIWRRFVGKTGLFLSVAIDPLGSIVLTGGDYTTTLSNYDAFIEKLDASGQLLWRQTGVHGNTESSGFDVATDACGNIFWAANAFIANVGQPSYLLKLAP